MLKQHNSTINTANRYRTYFGIILCDGVLQEFLQVWGKLLWHNGCAIVEGGWQVINGPGQLRGIQLWQSVFLSEWESPKPTQKIQKDIRCCRISLHPHPGNFQNVVNFPSGQPAAEELTLPSTTVEQNCSTEPCIDFFLAFLSQNGNFPKGSLGHFPHVKLAATKAPLTSCVQTIPVLDMDITLK